MRILLISNFSEGAGGIAVQVRLIHDHLAAEGLWCDILSTKGSLIKRLLAIIKLFRDGPTYDVFHVHACSDRGFLPAVIGVSVGRILRKRIVLTYHGGGAEEFFKRHPRLVHHFLTRADANIVLSGFVGEIYDNYNIPYTIIPNIVELDYGLFKRRDEIGPRFISIRSLYDIYNIKCTLRAFQKVQEHIPKASLILLGDGPLRAELESYVEQKGINSVSFVGQVKNDEIYHYLAQCDIMVSSSRFDNMPVSVLEGFNAGLLVIASKVGGIPYMIQDGVNGLLFECDDEEELAQKMIDAVERPSETLKMIYNAKQSLYQYSWDYCRPRLIKVYTGE